MLKVGEADVFPDEDVIRRGGATAAVTPKSMDVLVHLAEHAGETISAERLRRVVWQNDYIADNAVHKAVSEIRRALGDDPANPRYIRTVRQRGYRLVARVTVGEAEGAAPTVRERRPGFVGGVAAAVALVIGFFTWYFLTGPEPAPDPSIIAVLPFADMSPNGDQAHLSDGLAEELIVTLAQIEELQVVARTSAFAFRDAQTDVREIAKVLGVGSVVEGSVRTDGGRLRITAQLIRASDGYELWSGRFDRATNDVFAIQDEIARAVAAALQLELGIAASIRNAAVDFRGFELKKLGDYSLNKGDERSLRQALEYYAQAVAIVPTYSDAYASIAQAHMTAWWTGADPSDERRQRFIEAADRALAIDPDNPAALSTHSVTAAFDFRWADARRSLDRALALAPNDSGVMLVSTMLSSTLGDREAAMGFAQRAVELDPLNPNSQFTLGMEYASQGRWSEAAERLERAIHLGSANPVVRYDLAYIYHRLDRDADALDMLLNPGVEPAVEADLRGGFADGGYTGVLRRVVAMGPRDGPICGDYASNAAIVYSILGDIDDMYRCLEEAVDRRRALGITTAPSMAPYRDEPRFKALLTRMNLPYALPATDD